MKGLCALITLKEIAQMCGVSISTVSNTINGKPNVGEETRRKVLEVIERTGYKPNYFAQGMRKQKTRIVGIIAEDLTAFGTTPIVSAIMACLEGHNYRTVLINLRIYDKWQDTGHSSEQKLQSSLQPSIKELLSIKVDGIVYIAGHCRVINCFPDDFRIPAIVVYGLSKNPRFTSVIIDDKKGAYDITKYLISMGHRRIGVIAGAVDNLHTMNRIIGYQQALFDEKILFNPDLIRYGDWTRASGYNETGHLVNMGVTAIFSMNDVMAAGAYDYLHEKGIRIADDISVVGYDNNEISAYLRPALTTNQIQLKEIGEESAKIMLEMLENNYTPGKNPDITEIPCQLVIRESVKRIN
jgi:LacI family transcriptional regulator